MTSTLDAPITTAAALDLDRLGPASGRTCAAWTSPPQTTRHAAAGRR